MLASLSGCYFDIDNCGFPRSITLDARGGAYVIHGDGDHYYIIYNAEGESSYPYIRYEYPEDYDPDNPDPDNPVTITAVYDNHLDWLRIISDNPLIIKYEPNTTGKKRTLWIDNDDNGFGFGDYSFSITITQDK